MNITVKPHPFSQYFATSNGTGWVIPWWVISTATTFQQALSGSLGLSGAVVAKITGKTFEAGLGLAGSTVARISVKAFTASMPLTGAFSKTTLKDFTASVGLSSAFTKTAGKVVSATLGLSAAFTKTAIKVFAGSVGLSGAFAKSLSQAGKLRAANVATGAPQTGLTANTAPGPGHADTGPSRRE